MQQTTINIEHRVEEGLPDGPDKSEIRNEFMAQSAMSLRQSPLQYQPPLAPVAGYRMVAEHQHPPGMKIQQPLCIRRAVSGKGFVLVDGHLDRIIMRGPEVRALAERGREAGHDIRDPGQVLFRDLAEQIQFNLPRDGRIA